MRKKFLTMSSWKLLKINFVNVLYISLLEITGFFYLDFFIFNEII